MTLSFSASPTQTTAPPRPRPGWQLWTGRVLTALPVLLLLFSASMKLSHAPAMAQIWSAKLGYPEGSLTPIGLLEIACAAVYLVPRTAVLGAVLLTGYLGGAVATHVRVGDPFLVPLLVGVFVWAGLWLRDPHVRALLPLRPRGDAPLA
jgi:hypothetical protein